MDNQPQTAPVSETSIDFSYAFAPPHRMTVALPESSNKTLLDCEPGTLIMGWTYENLTTYPLVAFATPKTAWRVQFRPEIDGHPFGKSTWSRAEGYLPVLDNQYLDVRGMMRLEAVGGSSAAIIRVTVTNRGDRPHCFGLRCELLTGVAGHNPAWMDPALDPDVLYTRYSERADRIILFGLGADDYTYDTKATGLIWRLQPGETRISWVIRPYQASEADLPTLRKLDWETDFRAAHQVWRNLLGRSVSVQIPDSPVQQGLYACLADLFIMREPLADGYVGAIMGTEVYRQCNPFEGSLVVIALDQMGLHREAEDGLRVHLEVQEPSGEWADAKGWCHHMWAASGLKAWCAMEHYRLTGDRTFLAGLFPRLLASSRWQETQRARTRNLENGERPVTFGLMPRGMGDAGLMNDDDFYGVFFPHNILTVYADKLAVEAAEILGEQETLPELRRIYLQARDDLLMALERGAIEEDGYRWIPGVPSKTSGSRWGVLYAFYPCGLLAGDHELIEGTFRYIESMMSPGGHPIHTGWMQNGLWAAISLDNLAEAHLARGNGDAAVEYLYATLNHGTPLYTWCEERGQEPGTTECSGDRQHLWTPVALVRAVRDSLVMEDGYGLRLAVGTARSWLASEQPVGITDAPTYFGVISYQLRYNSSTQTVNGEAAFPSESALEWARLLIRLPGGLRVQRVRTTRPIEIMSDTSGLRWETPRGKYEFEISVG